MIINTTIPAILEYQSIQKLLVVLLVVLLANWLTIASKYHPMTLLRLVAVKMAEKVHPDTGRSVFQQRLSGTLAPLILVIPSLICLIITVELAQFPLFFDALLVFFCIQSSQSYKVLGRLQQQLTKNKKLLAKHTLAPFVLRETDTLSSMGIVKAATESMVLRFVLLWVTPLLCFILFGAWATVLYRMSYELHQCWNAKIYNNKHFGAPIRYVVQGFSWLPFHLTSLLMLVISMQLKHWRYSKSQRCARWQLLALMAHTLAIQLGGPCIYNGHKYRFPKVGTTYPPTPQHLLLLQHWLRALNIAWIITIILISTLMFLVEKNAI